VGFVKSFEFNENLLAIEKYKISATLTINIMAARKMIQGASDNLMDILYDPSVTEVFSSDTSEKLTTSVKKAHESLAGLPSLYTEGRCPLFSRLSIVDEGGRELMALREDEKSAMVPVESSLPLQLSEEPAFKKAKKLISLPIFIWVSLTPSKVGSGSSKLLLG